MKRARATFYYRLSLLMVSFAFIMFLVLLGSLFFLVIETLPPNTKEVCTPSASGICWLKEEYRLFNFIIISSIGLMAVFLILASQFQQYFIPESLAKLEKRRAEKEKERDSKLKKMIARKEIEVYESKSVDVDLLKKGKKAKKSPVLLKKPSDINEQDILENVDVLSDEAVSEVIHEEPPLTEDKKELKTKEPPIEDPEELDDETSTSEERVEVKTIDEADIDVVDTKKSKEEKTPKKTLKPVLDVTKKRRTQAHTKEDLSIVIESLTNLSAKEAREFLDTFTHVLSEELVKHQKIAIHQFGTFSTTELKARKMNVPTKEEGETEIAAHHVIRFKPSPSFMDYLNDESVTSPPIEPVEVQQNQKKQAKRDVNTENGYNLERLKMSIVKATPLNQTKAKTFLEALTQTIQDALVARNPVSINQFGTFKVVKKPKKMMVVPTKDEPVEIPEHYAVEFKPTKVFIDAINPKE